MNKNIKFGLIIVVILGTLGWLAAGRHQPDRQLLQGNRRTGETGAERGR